MLSQPFDLSKMDYEAARHQRRRRLLQWSAAPIAVVVLLALWFLLPSILTHQAISQYNRKNYASARHWLVPLTWSSPEPFVAAFDIGTTDTQLKHYPAAESELTRALAYAPASKRCMVVQNLVYTLEAHGNSLLPSDPHDAAVYFSKGLNTIHANAACFKGSGSLGQLQQDKQQAQSQEAAAAAQASSEAPSAPQEQQLQQKEQLGEQRQSQDIHSQTYNPNSTHIKQW